MSNSLTEPSKDLIKVTPEELAMIRVEGDRRRKMLYGWDREPLPRAQIGALARQAEMEFTIDGGPPASIAYLHSLVVNGLGDRYNWHDHEFEVKINWADKAREPNLSGVETVTLCYRGED